MEELKLQIMKLKEENLHLQKMVSGNNDILGDIKKIEEDMKAVRRIRSEKLHFIDRLLIFYDEVIDYVNMSDKEVDYNNIEYFLFKMIESYENFRSFLQESVSTKKIDEMDSAIDYCKISDIDDKTKIDFFYNSFYDILFVEFLGEFTYSVSV